MIIPSYILVIELFILLVFLLATWKKFRYTMTGSIALSLAPSVSLLMVAYFLSPYLELLTARDVVRSAQIIFFLIMIVNYGYLAIKGK
jgi:hypothetical protein